MKVQATRPGFYGTRRREGSVFVLEDKAHFSDRWMERAGKEAKPDADKLKGYFQQPKAVQTSLEMPVDTRSAMIAAFQKSGLDMDEWNGLKQDDRKARILEAAEEIAKGQSA